MTTLIDIYGYPFLSLRTKGPNGESRKTPRIHKLVMLAFVGPCPRGMEVCHNDGDRTNNLLANLRYDTHQNNMRDAIRHGTCCLQPLVSAGTRQEIIKRRAAGAHYRVIARQLRVGMSTIAKTVKSDGEPARAAAS